MMSLNYIELKSCFCYHLYMELNSIITSFCNDSFAPNDTNVSISLDGSRIITLGNQNIDLNTLAKEAIRMSGKAEADNLSVKNRITGIELIDKINIVYKKTDSQIRTKNIVTQALSWIRDLFVRDQLGKAWDSFRGFSPRALNPDWEGSNFGRIYLSVEALKALHKP